MKLNPKIVAPIAALGATWAARRIMITVYQKRTGHVPPAADDPEVSLRRVIMWSIATAMVSATIEVVITRLAAEFEERELTAAPSSTPDAALPKASENGSAV